VPRSFYSLVIVRSHSVPVFAPPVAPSNLRERAKLFSFLLHLTCCLPSPLFRWFVEQYPKLAEDPHVALPKTARWLADASADVSAAKREHEAGAEAAIAAGLPSEFP
jgi:hypothetical protein